MLQHGTALVVAILLAATAFAEGGYSTELIAAGAIATWLLVILGILARWWRGGGAITREAVVAGALLAALGAWTALSMLWADDAGRSFAEVVRMGAYLGLFALFVLLVGAIGPRPLFSGLALGLAAVALAALATRLLPGVFGSDDAEIFASLPAASGRLSFPIGYWNGLAVCMAALLVLLGWFSAVASTAERRSLAAALVPVPVLVIYFASSRGGAAAALAGVVVLALLLRQRIRLVAGLGLGVIAGVGLVLVSGESSDLVAGLDTASAREMGALIAIGTVLSAIAIAWLRTRLEPRLDAVRVPRPDWRVSLAALVIGLILAFVIADPIERVEEFAAAPSGTEEVRPAAGDLVRGSGSGRSQYWDAAFGAFASDPLRGIGAGNYELWWGAEGTLPRQIVDAHSLYLEVLAELGIIGVLLLGGFLVAIALALRRGARGGIGDEAGGAAALLAAVLLAAGIDWIWELPAAFIPAIAGAAILAAAPAGAIRAVQPGPVKSPPRLLTITAGGGFGVGIAVLALAWACIWASGMLLVTELKLGDSREAAAQGDFPRALEDALDAAAIQPWSPEPVLQQAQIELLGGDVSGARVAAERAISKAPSDWRTWFVAARVEGAAGDEAGRREALERAFELAPLPLPGEEVAR